MVRNITKLRCDCQNKMNIPHKDLITFKEHLKHFEYPFINQKTDVEITQIFAKENRIFFLTWILNKLYPQYEHRIDVARMKDKIENALANILYENGFCSMAQKQNFVTNGIESDTKIQMKILKKMFNFLSLTTAFEADKENAPYDLIESKEIFKKFSRENATKIILPNLNIFPTYDSAFKRSSPTERDEILKCFKSEIEKMKSEEIINSSSLEKTVEIEGDLLLEEIEEVEKLKRGFLANKTDIIFHSGDGKDMENSDLENYVENNVEKVNKMIEMIEKRQILKKIFNLEEKTETDSILIDEYSSCVLQHFVSTEKILKDSKKS